MMTFGAGYIQERNGSRCPTSREFEDHDSDRACAPDLPEGPGKWWA